MNYMINFVFGALLFLPLVACQQEESPQNTLPETSMTTPSDTGETTTPQPSNGTPNAPLMMEGMTGVFWDSDGVEQTVTEENADSWYHYLAQTGTEDGKTSRWANAKTEDGSYWVWIP